MDDFFDNDSVPFKPISKISRDDKSKVLDESTGLQAEKAFSAKGSMNELEPVLKDVRHTLAFFGKPGSGKSSTANSLAGREVFESGIAKDASSLTRGVQSHIEGKVMIVDTPGLGEVDQMRAEEAFQRVYSFLTGMEKLRLCFVFDVQTGRLDSVDLTNVFVVLKSLGKNIESSKPTFSILWNKVPSMDLGKFHSGIFRTLMEKVAEKIEYTPTCRPFYMELVHSFTGYWEPSKEWRNDLMMSSPEQILNLKIKEIKTDIYDKAQSKVESKPGQSEIDDFFD
jgi:GTP-binding protein EngB required for normal cell division